MTTILLCLASRAAALRQVIVCEPDPTLLAAPEEDVRGWLAGGPTPVRVLLEGTLGVEPYAYVANPSQEPVWIAASALTRDEGEVEAVWVVPVDALGARVVRAWTPWTLPRDSGFDWALVGQDGEDILFRRWDATVGAPSGPLLRVSTFDVLEKQEFIEALSGIAKDEGPAQPVELAVGEGVSSADLLAQFMRQRVQNDLAEAFPAPSAVDKLSEVRELEAPREAEEEILQGEVRAVSVTAWTSESFQLSRREPPGEPRSGTTATVLPSEPVDALASASGTVAVMAQVHPAIESVSPVAPHFEGTAQQVVLPRPTSRVVPSLKGAAQTAEVVPRTESVSPAAASNLRVALGIKSTGRVTEVVPPAELASRVTESASRIVPRVEGMALVPSRAAESNSRVAPRIPGVAPASWVGPRAEPISPAMEPITRVVPRVEQISPGAEPTSRAVPRLEGVTTPRIEGTAPEAGAVSPADKLSPPIPSEPTAHEAPSIDSMLRAEFVAPIVTRAAPRIAQRTLSSEPNSRVPKRAEQVVQVPAPTLVVEPAPPPELRVQAPAQVLWPVTRRSMPMGVQDLVVGASVTEVTPPLPGAVVVEPQSPIAAVPSGMLSATVSRARPPQAEAVAPIGQRFLLGDSAAPRSSEGPTTAAPTVSLRPSARFTVSRTVEIGEIVVELGRVAAASRPALLPPQVQTGSLIAAIPSLRSGGGRR